MPSNRMFVMRLHQLLDDIETPKNSKERAQAFAKLFKLPGRVSHLILNGILMPQEALLQQISEEFEVSEDWLLGRGKPTPNS